MNPVLCMGIICLLISLAAWTPALIRSWKRLRSPRALWISGEYQGMTKRGHVIWVLQGVFNTRERALAACTKKNHFITRLELNQPLPENTENLPTVEYPLINEAA